MNSQNKNLRSSKTPDTKSPSPPKNLQKSTSKSPIFPPIESNKTNNSFRNQIDITSLNKNINNNINMNYNPSGNINPNFLGFLPNISNQNYKNNISPNLDFNNDSTSENIK